MSCEGSQGAFFSHQAGQSAVMAAFGGSPEQAQQALEQVYALARAQAEQAKTTLGTDRVSTLRVKAEDEQAKALTKALFARMQALGLPPPTHSKSGLPKRDARYGYAAIERTLRAIEGRTALPSLAKQVRESLEQERRISAISITRGNLGRCENCGRFASRTKAHICPQTASPDVMQQALMRRFGVPATAYPAKELQSLIDQAKSGDLNMRHNITGERVGVTLDGLMVAMRGGFVPESWSTRKGLAQVELASGAIVPVLNATNLNQVNLSQGTGAQQAAAASGVALPVSSLPASATSLPLASAARPIPSLHVQPVSGAQISIDDRYATDYDYGHFLGTEFMKRADGSYGTTITADGVDYTIGDRFKEPEHRSSARDTGLVPAARGGVAVGRTLVAAAGLIKSGAIVVAERPAHDGQGAPRVESVEVYSAGGHDVIGACTPYTFGAKKGFIAADIDGNANASAEQMAAIIAYRALYPQTALDHALASDLADYINGGTKSAVAVADSAWITISDDLKQGGSLELGGGLGASRCPDCGRFMGSAHHCPNKQAAPDPSVASAPAQPEPAPSVAAAPVPAQAEPTVVTVPAPEPAPVPQVNVNVNLDTEALANAIKEGQQAPNVTVSIDTEALANAIKEGQQPSVVQLDSTALAAALKEGLKGVVGAAPAQADNQLTESMNRLAAALTGSDLPVASPAPAAAALDDEPITKQPRTGFQRDSSMPPTAVEHILKAVRLPAPDPYLSQVPESVGGNRRTALHEDIPAPDPHFEVNEQTERILRVMSATLQAGAGKQKNTWSRAFSVYGPPGTGKNSLARQLAASVKVVDNAGNETQGISYTEVNITPQTSIEEAIGTTILTKDPQSGQTVSRAQLGKIGLAAAMGSVICVNEIVRNPKLATALQSMLEDGEIQINSPEAGLIRIPVHPSTVFVMTWNPGLEGDAERPAKAPLERTIPLHLGAPTEAEQIRRLESFFTQFDDTSSQGKASSGGNEQRRKEILAKNYAINTTDLTLSDAEKSAAVRFFKQINEIAGEQMDNQQIGTNSSMPTGPGPRQLSRFAMLGKTVGWKEALETLRICCDQDDGFASQWAIVSKHFETFFGRDGQGLSRTQPQQRG